MNRLSFSSSARSANSWKIYLGAVNESNNLTGKPGHFSWTRQRPFAEWIDQWNRNCIMINIFSSHLIALVIHRIFDWHHSLILSRSGMLARNLHRRHRRNLEFLSTRGRQVATIHFATECGFKQKSEFHNCFCTGGRVRSQHSQAEAKIYFSICQDQFFISTESGFILDAHNAYKEAVIYRMWIQVEIGVS